MTISRKNINKPAPVWFRKLKKAITVLSDTAAVMLLAMGYADNSLAMLIVRIAISGVLNSMEVFLSDEKNA